MLPMKQFSFSCHFISFLFIIFSHVQVHYTEEVDERSKTKALFRQYSDQVNMKANILSKITLKTAAAVLNNITSFKLFNAFFWKQYKVVDAEKLQRLLHENLLGRECLKNPVHSVWNIL